MLTMLFRSFFRLWKHADQIGSREEAEALTVVTVKNLCIDTLRRRNHLPTVELDENRMNLFPILRLKVWRKKSVSV